MKFQRAPICQCNRDTAFDTDQVAVLHWSVAIRSRSIQRDLNVVLHSPTYHHHHHHLLAPNVR